MAQKVILGWQREVLYFCARLTWRWDVRPPVMYRVARPVLPVDVTEWLFLRWFSNYYKGDGAIDPDQVTLPDQSLNRTSCSTYSGKFWHVLMPDPNEAADKSRRKLRQGVLKMTGRSLTHVISEGGSTYAFVIEHDPLDHNYGHVELRIYVDGVRMDKAAADALTGSRKAAWKQARKKFRVEASKFSRNGEMVDFLRSEVATGRQN